MQVDRYGNVNPSILPGRLPGPGGFPVISFGSPRIIFTGGFTAGRRDIRVKDRQLKIVKDGSVIKFVNQVYKIVYNGQVGLERDQHNREGSV